MADRYQDRRFPAGDDYGRGGESHAAGKDESDPLAELARLIGQTDPFGTIGRANLPLQPRAREPDPYDPQNSYEPPPETDVRPAAGQPSWMQRTARQETPPPPPPPQQDYPDAVHPLHRYAAVPEVDYSHAPHPADADHERDLSRYDDALYGSHESDAADPQYNPAYADDAYAYQDDYDDGAEHEVPKRRGRMGTVVAVLALAVLGTGGALAYRTYMGSARSGEPPIIRADASPTKIVPAPADGSTKVPDRMSIGDRTEKIVSREEAPVDVNARSAPRVVFPPLNPNGNPPPAAGVAPGSLPSANSGNGTLSNNEPRRIRTFAVRGDQADAAATAVTGPPPATAKPAATARAAAPAAAPHPPSAANASVASANAPISLAPQPAQPAAEPATRVAATNPAQNVPGGGGFLVQVSSQRSEADAQASYRALQGKYPGVLGSQASVVKRVDLGEKGVYYRAFAGPFSSADQATQVCSNLKAAGGPQCLIQRN
jgi:hypothetical protein